MRFHLYSRLRLIFLALGATVMAVGCDQPPEITPQVTSGPQPPQVIAVDPPNGAHDVDPARRTLSVTFDRDMNRQGWSWVVENDQTAPDIAQDASFDQSGRTNTVSVTLEPGKHYVVWINSDQFQYFTDTRGTPSTPFRWTFATLGEAGAADDPHLLELPGTAPTIVALDPPNGATDVDPARTTLSVTFDRPMREGWSWVIEPGALFPETVGDPSYDPEQLTNTLGVRLEPNMSYVIWLNSEKFTMFGSEEGVPLVPYRWTFTTGASGR